MTTQEILANIVNNGNKILLVGGGFSKLNIDHPKVIVWDDEVQDFNSKQVPITVKAVLYGRAISHKTASRLNVEINRLKALKFPMLKPNEVRNLLSQVVKELEPIKEEQPVVEIKPPEPIVITKSPKKFELKNFVIKNLKLDVDYSIRGAVKKESNRLFPLATAQGIKTTPASMDQAVAKLLREMKENKNKPIVVKEQTVNKFDDFAELKRLLSDAMASIKLVSEHIIKVEKEVEQARASRAKLLKVLKE